MSLYEDGIQEIPGKGAKVQGCKGFSKAQCNSARWWEMVL